MSDFNLNDPNQFAALTSQFGSVFGQPQNQQWAIVQSSFRNVPFHIFGSAQASGQTENYAAAVPRVQDRTGRRKVFYQFPFKDGQTSGDLGRSPFIFEFDVVFFGANYFSGYTAFYNALNQATPATLRHPVLGDINCVAPEWEVIHESMAKLSLAMRVTFQEHTYDPGLTFQNVPATSSPVSTGKPGTFKSAVIAALSVFQTLNSIQTAITANQTYAKSFINGVKSLISTYKASYLNTLSSIYQSFSPDAVTLAPDLPGVLPVNLGGQVNSSGNTQSSLYPLTNSSVTPFSQISTPSTSNANILTPSQATNAVNAVLALLEQIIQLINGGNAGQGALDFYDQILSLKQSGQQMRQALLTGLASSNNITTQYTVPPVIPFMSIREVAFAIGLDINLSDQIRILNPELLSVNQIPGGMVLNIPVISG